MDASLFTSMLFATVVAGTPLIIVALGLLVNEKAGVLNLGAEGMMAMGAVAAFAVTHESGNPWLGVAAGMGAGMAMPGAMHGADMGMPMMDMMMKMMEQHGAMLAQPK